MGLGSDTCDLLTRLLRDLTLDQGEDSEVPLADLLYDLGVNKSVAELRQVLSQGRPRQPYHPVGNLTEKELRDWLDRHPEEQATLAEWVQLIALDEAKPYWAGYLITSLHRSRLLACWLCGQEVPSDWADTMLSAEIDGDHVRKVHVLIV